LVALVKYHFHFLAKYNKWLLMKKAMKFT